MIIKICGVRDRAAALIAEQAGAQFLGFNFVSTSPRYIKPERAAAIIRCVENTIPVGVFRDHTLEEIRAIARPLCLPWIQLHGDETPEMCAELAREFQLIKAFRVDRDFSTSHCLTYAPFIRYYLFDGPQPGSGKSFDWDAISAELPRPFILAGGLNPDNVGEAIRRLQPDGVDTASGVEVAGQQDMMRIQLFCVAALSSYS